MEQTLEDMIASAMQHRTSIKALDDERKAQEVLFKELQAKILEKMQEQGVKSTGTDVANVSVSEITHANVTDWDAFYAFMSETGYMHLLQKRISSKAAQEVLAVDGVVPGVDFYVEPRLNLRKKS